MGSLLTMEYRVIEHFADKGPKIHPNVFLEFTPKAGETLNHLVRLDIVDDLLIIDLDYTSGLIELHVQNALSPTIELYKSNYDAPGCDSDGEYL
jgi:hypothetical protein